MKTTRLLLGLVCFAGWVQAATANSNANAPDIVIADWDSGNAAAECTELTATTGVTYYHALKIDVSVPDGNNVPNGVYTGDGNTITITNSQFDDTGGPPPSNPNQQQFDWSSLYGIDAVIVKAGTGANVYTYNNATSDTALWAFEGRKISHATFCWNFRLQVSKTAETTFDRDWTWTIEKSGPAGPAVTPLGAFYLANYTVEVDAESQDSNWAVSGQITIVNPDPDFNATITGVSDVISDGINATVDCGVTFPYDLAPGESLVCEYDSALPDGASRTNTATATTSGPVKDGSGTAAVTFGDPTNETDECADVTDSLYGSLGTVCKDELPKTFTYEYNHEQTTDTCQEDGSFDNTASFTTNDNAETGSSSWSIPIDFEACNDTGDGCTLTQGYWKTHSLNGPAPYDDAWLLVGAAGADTPFFNSGKSYYQILWTAPAGNAYYNLAHQYIAAKLNILNGATPTAAVSAAITWAETYFSGIASGTPAPTGTLRNQVLQRATTLDQFNNGLIGPGHCSE